MNPRTAINSLLPFQGSPFNHLGTSAWLRVILLLILLPAFGQKVSGEGGIRTHAPLRTNGFQDRLVMTTSIPLRNCLIIISHQGINVKHLFLFFQHFFKEKFKLEKALYLQAFTIIFAAIIKIADGKSTRKYLYTTLILNFFASTSLSISFISAPSEISFPSKSSYPLFIYLISSTVV